MINTVCGPIEVKDLGITLSHEHLFLDLTNQFSEPTDPEEQRVSKGQVIPDHYQLLMRNPYAIRDNLIIDNLEIVVSEIESFKALEGKSIVECTSIGIHRNPGLLRELSQRTGINIIVGCGYYTADTHPREVREEAEEQLAKRIVGDLEEGIDGTDIRAGIIGEIGTSDPIHPDEIKVLRASAMANQLTGAAIQVHTYPWGTRGLEALDVLEKAGTEPNRVVICHTDVALVFDYIVQLLQRGCYIQFDNFGKEFEPDLTEESFAGGAFASDLERVQVLKKLLDKGYGEQLLVTNDICFKCMLQHYGGKGYSHVLDGIIQMMNREGINPETVDLIFRENPARLLNMVDANPAIDS